MRPTDPFQITDGIYMVGSSEMTDSRDCSVYLLDVGELVLIDAGAGPSASRIAANIERLGKDIRRLTTLIVTHCHIDHSGGANFFRERFGTRIVMHELDATPVRQGDRRMTAAAWYSLDFPPTPVDLAFSDEERVLNAGSAAITCLHTPGHTPGSISCYTDLNGERLLFGQDIHGPFHSDFGSDIAVWRSSMQKLLKLNADVLCEGHFGVYRPAERVSRYIEHYLETYSEESP